MKALQLQNIKSFQFFFHFRLKFATEFRDRAAERRAYSNLGNCHVFLGEFARAAECYRRYNDESLLPIQRHSFGKLQKILTTIITYK